MPPLHLVQAGAAQQRDVRILLAPPAACAAADIAPSSVGPHGLPGDPRLSVPGTALLAAHPLCSVLVAPKRIKNLGPRKLVNPLCPLLLKDLLDLGRERPRLGKLGLERLEIAAVVVIEHLQLGEGVFSLHQLVQSRDLLVGREHGDAVVFLLTLLLELLLIDLRTGRLLGLRTIEVALDLSLPCPLPPVGFLPLPPRQARGFGSRLRLGGDLFGFGFLVFGVAVDLEVEIVGLVVDRFIARPLGVVRSTSHLRTPAGYGPPLGGE